MPPALQVGVALGCCMLVQRAVSALAGIRRPARQRQVGHACAPCLQPHTKLDLMKEHSSCVCNRMLDKQHLLRKPLQVV